MPNTSLLFGPLLIGVFLNTILYGVCVVQSFIYYQTYKRDATWIRYFVLYLFILETLNTGFDIGLVFEPLVLNYGEPQSYTVSPTMIIADPLVTVLISTPVQFFIAWRIKIISGSIVMPLIIAFFGTCAFIGGVALTISVSLIREWARFTQFEGAVITWLTASAAADLLITTALTWSLARRKTGIKSTDDKVSRIIRLTIQTGLVTAVFALADVLIFLTVKHTTLNFIWDLALSKLYTNSLLSTLNARAGWNNLSGQFGDEGSNILFGRGSNSRIKGRQHGSVGPSHTMSNVIELETPAQSGHCIKLGGLESGITVHTVVEHLTDDIKSNVQQV